MNDFISVIIPIYNVEEYLTECITSVINQTYKEFEIILIDDGSTDHSGKICDDFAKMDSRILVVHKKNGGLSSARNCGLSIAKGNYITFVDSDDYVSKDYLEILYKEIKKEADIDIVICRFYNVKIQKDGNYQAKECVSKACNEYYSGEDILQQRFGPLRVLFVIAMNKMYRKELFLTLRYEEGMNHEDEIMASRLYSICNKVKCINEPLYYYRIRPNSIMTINSESTMLDELNWLISEIHGDYAKYPDEVTDKIKKMFFHNFRHLKRVLNKRDRDKYRQIAQQYRIELIRNSSLNVTEKIKLIFSK